MYKNSARLSSLQLNGGTTASSLQTLVRAASAVGLAQGGGSVTKFVRGEGRVEVGGRRPDPGLLVPDASRQEAEANIRVTESKMNDQSKPSASISAFHQEGWPMVTRPSSWERRWRHVQHHGNILNEKRRGFMLWPAKSVLTGHDGRIR